MLKPNHQQIFMIFQSMLINLQRFHKLLKINILKPFNLLNTGFLLITIENPSSFITILLLIHISSTLPQTSFPSSIFIPYLPNHIA